MKEIPGFLGEIEDLLRPHYAAVIAVLKQRGECSLRDLAAALGMSYTGLQPHCERMRGLGVLERRRQVPKSTGRPVLSYRLGPAAKKLFPSEAGDNLLALLQQAAIFGATAPERILMQHFKVEAERIGKSVAKGKSIVEKATRLVDARRKAGHWADCGFDKGEGLSITEYHHPLEPVFDAYPNARRFELQGMENLLGSRIVFTTNRGINYYRLNTLG